MEELRRRFQKWREAFETKRLRVNIKKTKMMVSVREGELARSKIDPCGVCGKRVMANSVLCLKCMKWIHGRCAKVNGVTPRLATDFVCVFCMRIMEEVVEPMESFYDGVETVKRFCCLGDRLNVCCGCEMAVTARARLGWVKFRECEELLHGKKFLLKGRIHQTCVRSVMRYGSETWCLRENEVAILRQIERAIMIRAMCGVKFIDKKITEEWMFMLGLKESKWCALVRTCFEEGGG